MTAAERLAQAKASLTEAERLIAKLNEQIDTALRLDQIAHALAASEDLIEAQRIKKLRERQIELLPALVAAEESERWIPRTEAGLRRNIAEGKARRRVLELMHPSNRGAAGDTELHRLNGWIGEWEKNLRGLEARK